MLDRFNVWVGSLIARTQDMKNESGQTFVEYALILAVVVVALLLAYTTTALGPAISGALKKVTDALK